MFFLMRCLHHSGMGAKRDTHRAEHRDWVKSGGDGLAAVLIGSALVDDDGASIGHFGILEAKDMESARGFAEDDPYARAGIVRTIDLTPLPDTFQAHRISDPMSVLK